MRVIRLNIQTFFGRDGKYKESFTCYVLREIKGWIPAFARMTDRKEGKVKG